MQIHLLDIKHIILTDKLVIRRFKEEDGPKLLDLIQNNRDRLEDQYPHISQQVKTTEEATFWVHQKVANWLLQEEYYLAIWNIKTAKLMAWVNIHQFDWTIPSGYFHYFSDKQFEERLELNIALNKIIDFCFEELKLSKINQLVPADETIALRLARNCRFRREGDIRLAFKRGETELIDAIHFGLTPEDINY